MEEENLNRVTLWAGCVTVGVDCPSKLGHNERHRIFFEEVAEWWECSRRSEEDLFRMRKWLKALACDRGRQHRLLYSMLGRVGIDYTQLEFVGAVCSFEHTEVELALRKVRSGVQQRLLEFLEVEDNHVVLDEDVLQGLENAVETSGVLDPEQAVKHTLVIVLSRGGTIPLDTSDAVEWLRRYQACSERVEVRLTQWQSCEVLRTPEGSPYVDPESGESHHLDLVLEWHHKTKKVHLEMVEGVRVGDLDHMVRLFNLDPWSIVFHRPGDGLELRGVKADLYCHRPNGYSSEPLSDNATSIVWGKWVNHPPGHYRTKDWHGHVNGDGITTFVVIASESADADGRISRGIAEIHVWPGYDPEVVAEVVGLWRYRGDVSKYKV